MTAVSLYFEVLRKRRGFTQESLALMLGVNQRQVQRWLVESQPMKLETVALLIEKLRASPEHVFRLLKSDASPELARDLVSELLGKEIIERVEVAEDQELDLARIIGQLRQHPELIQPVDSFVSGATDQQRRSRKRQG